ncbi:MAG TPA: DUF502 domain-containing protein [Archaeoglobaceae archaeon]|nr:DUF502 domain-containing protein [Archaeoglobaceae archaeon]
MTTVRNILLTGLLIFIPISATIFITYWTFTYIDNLIKPIVIKATGFYFPGLSWIFLIGIILILGVIGRFTIGNRVVNSIENLMKKVPVVRTIYTATKEASKAILVSETERIKGVVLVEYPRRGIYAIGFTTGAEIKEAGEKTGKKTVNVFIPTSPNPTSGYVILVPEEDLIYLDLTVEEALKVIISGGFTKS